MIVNETHAMLREAVQNFAKTRLAPGAKSRDDEEAFDADLFREFANVGLLGVTVPETYGGARWVPVLIELLGLSGWLRLEGRSRILTMPRWQMVRHFG